MASDGESKKRKTTANKSSTLIVQVADVTLCPHCSRRFDDGERTPRVLHCGHSVCTACVDVLVQRISASKWTIACPVDKKDADTPVDKGDAKMLGKNFALAAAVELLSTQTPVLRLLIRNKSAAVKTDRLLVTPDLTIGSAKKQFEIEHPEYPVQLHWQVWSVLPADKSKPRIVLDDERSVGSYAFDSGDLIDLGAVPNIFVCNEAGARMPLMLILSDTIKEAKERLQSEHPEYPAPLQVWSVMLDPKSAAITELDDARTIGWYGLQSGSVVGMMMLGGFHGGASVCTVNGKFNAPGGMCTSVDGTLLCICEMNSNRVQILLTADDSLVRTIGMKGVENGQFKSPSGACFSPNNELLFVADQHNNRVQVFRVLDGEYLRTIGNDCGQQLKAPEDVCTSPCGELLYITDSGNHRVQVHRASDGAHVRTIGSKGIGAGQFARPNYLCVSPSGEQLFVSDLESNCVQVLSATSGQYLRTIGSKGTDIGQFKKPQGVCVTSSGEWLIVADSGNCRVQVFCASDGSHVRTIGRKGKVKQDDDDENGPLDWPVGVCSASTRSGNRLYVVESHSNRVQVFTV